MDLGEWSGKSLKVLQEEIINYQEEQIAHDEDGEDQEGGQGDGEDQESGDGQDVQ